MFLFGHFFGFGPGALRNQYLATDAVLLTPFPQSLYHWHTHTHTQRTMALAAASPTTFCLRSISGPRTTHTGAGRRQTHYVLPSFYLWPTHKKHWRSPPPAPLPSAFPLSLSHAQHTLSQGASQATLCLRLISGPRTRHSVARRLPRYALPSLSHYIAGPTTLTLSLGTTAVQRRCKSAAIRVPGLPWFANLLQCSHLKATRPENPQVWRQSVQMYNHHFCSGMPLNPLFNVIETGDISDPPRKSAALVTSLSSG